MRRDRKMKNQIISNHERMLNSEGEGKRRKGTEETIVYDIVSRNCLYENHHHSV